MFVLPREVRAPAAFVDEPHPHLLCGLEFLLACAQGEGGLTADPLAMVTNGTLPHATKIIFQTLVGTFHDVVSRCEGVRGFQST